MIIVINAIHFSCGVMDGMAYGMPIPALNGNTKMVAKWIVNQAHSQTSQLKMAEILSLQQ
jgi:hypothetical protein